MYKSFSNIDDLFREVSFDKYPEGSQAFTANRYPIRFVLFDNFRDSYKFVEKMQAEQKCTVESIENWFDEPHVDVMFTHSKVANKLKQFVNEHQEKDYVITPFSELVRFYDNDNIPEFHTLIATIKGIENDSNPSHRVYVPIIGLEGKFSQFEHDSQIHVWYFRNSDQQLNYKLIVTNGDTYHVQGLENRFTIVTDMRNWLHVWRNKNAKQQIISTSPTIFAQIQYAQPDNAFSYCECNNVYDFLTKGLHLNFGTLDYKTADEKHWLRLAKEINIKNFSFEQFFNSYFHIDDLSDYLVFIDKWFACKDEFEKWLLCSYYTYKFCEKGYICKAIKNAESFIDYHFFASITLSVFDEENPEQDLEERLACLQAASTHCVKLTIDVQNELRQRLLKLAGSKGYLTAIRYLSPLTDVEKSLTIEWIGKGYVQREAIQTIYPELYYYLGNDFGMSDSILQWIPEYMEKYRVSKLANTYSESIRVNINEKNASAITFNKWYQELKTVKTILNSRSDIEVYYWIDGLGIEWIPLVSHLIEQKEGIFLNEIQLARAIYPTTTDINKKELLDLAKGDLEKEGDLDTHAHKQGNRYPEYIIEEFEILKKAVDQIVSQFAGRKVAIVSDHGLTALSQYCDGLNLKGFSSDHGGRLAVINSGTPTRDLNYIICDDNKTVCALRHESLCGKTPLGQSAHGGCTPEEVIIPIFILSNEKTCSTVTVTLVSKEISAANAVISFRIKGNNATDKPYVLYANQRYELHQEKERFSTDKIITSTETDEVTLFVGTFKKTYHVKINTGSEEDENLFDL